MDQSALNDTLNISTVSHQEIQDMMNINKNSRENLDEDFRFLNKIKWNFKITELYTEAIGIEI